MNDNWCLTSDWIAYQNKMWLLFNGLSLKRKTFSASWVAKPALAGSHQQLLSFLFFFFLRQLLQFSPFTKYSYVSCRVLFFERVHPHKQTSCTLLKRPPSLNCDLHCKKRLQKPDTLMAIIQSTRKQQGGPPAFTLGLKEVSKQLKCLTFNTDKARKFIFILLPFVKKCSKKIYFKGEK